MPIISTFSIELRNHLLNVAAALSNLQVIAQESIGGGQFANLADPVSVVGKFAASANGEVNFLAQESASIPIPSGKTVARVVLQSTLPNLTGPRLLCDWTGITEEFEFGGNLIINNIRLRMVNPT